ncbi:MAG: class I SAM-dependent methyltransferase [Nocardiopsaceae bacterium]|nr:class I SAM-dependent methyltransferase [Nocardiopsaceae bacterium]
MVHTYFADLTSEYHEPSGDYEPAELPILAAAEARGDSTGWFEELYAAGAACAAPMPWSRTEPHALLVEWAEAEQLHGPGRAVVVGCALGADAEFISGRGFDTTGFDISHTAIRSAQQRHQGSGVEYAVASVLDLPGSWHRAFDLVVEIITVQALPDDVRPRAIAGVVSLVAAGAVTIGQALHWMDYRELFPALVPLLRPGGGVAVITNGTPLWLHDSAWSQALRGFLEQWLDTTLTSACGTDEASQQRYRDTMTAAGFEVTDASFEYTDELDLDHLVGGLYSAMRLPPPDQRAAFAEQVRHAVAPHERFTEPVLVRMLLGRPR